MSKLSFRARQLDAAKPMPVYMASELADLSDYAMANRAVPQMPSGMEKEEEMEHHLQRAISAQMAFGTEKEKLLIPTPEANIEVGYYDGLYKADQKQTRQLIHVQPLGIENEMPDYDMDSEDEKWAQHQTKLLKMDLPPLKFEEMLDRLEKGSGQQVVTLKEAKALLKEDDDLVMAVYDYWLNKRLKYERPLIPQVKSEKRDGSTNNNPYVAFRRRSEKMQTRKNRKNDEQSYEKMMRVKRELERVTMLLDLLRKREKQKKELLHLTIEVFEKRYTLEDFSGEIFAAAVKESKLKEEKPIPLIANGAQLPLALHRDWSRVSSEDTLRRKRDYKKRKHKVALSAPPPPAAVSKVTHHHVTNTAMLRDSGTLDFRSSDDDYLSADQSASEADDDNDPDGQFSFRRNKHCNYYAARFQQPADWPWAGGDSLVHGDSSHYRYSLASLSRHTDRAQTTHRQRSQRHPDRQRDTQTDRHTDRQTHRQRLIGLCRRRIGRGGRVVFDRLSIPLDGLTDPDLYTGLPNTEHWLHFTQRSPRRRCSEEFTGSSGDESAVDSDDSLSSTATEPLLSSTLPSATCLRSAAAGSADYKPNSFLHHQKALLAIHKRHQSSAATTTPTIPLPSDKTQQLCCATLNSSSAKFAASALATVVPGDARAAVRQGLMDISATPPGFTSSNISSKSSPLSHYTLAHKPTPTDRHSNSSHPTTISITTVGRKAIKTEPSDPQSNMKKSLLSLKGSTLSELLSTTPAESVLQLNYPLQPLHSQTKTHTNTRLQRPTIKQQQQQQQYNLVNGDVVITPKGQVQAVRTMVKKVTSNNSGVVMVTSQAQDPSSRLSSTASGALSGTSMAMTSLPTGQSQARTTNPNLSEHSNSVSVATQSHGNNVSIATQSPGNNVTIVTQPRGNSVSMATQSHSNSVSVATQSSLPQAVSETKSYCISATYSSLDSLLRDGKPTVPTGNTALSGTADKLLTKRVALNCRPTSDHNS